MIALLGLVRMIALSDFCCLPLFLVSLVGAGKLSSSSSRITLCSVSDNRLGPRWMMVGEFGRSSSDRTIVSSLTTLVNRLELDFGVILSNMTESRLAAGEGALNTEPGDGTLNTEAGDGTLNAAPREPEPEVKKAESFLVVTDLLIDLLSGLTPGLFSMMNRSASARVLNFLCLADLNLCT